MYVHVYSATIPKGQHILILPKNWIRSGPQAKNVTHVHETKDSTTSIIQPCPTTSSCCIFHMGRCALIRITPLPRLCNCCFALALAFFGAAFPVEGRVVCGCGFFGLTATRVPDVADKVSSSSGSSNSGCTVRWACNSNVASQRFTTLNMVVLLGEERETGGSRNQSGISSGLPTDIQS